MGYFLAIAEKQLGIPAERLAAMPGLVRRADSALYAPKAGFSGQEQYADFAMKAAVLCARLIKNHPLPDGNKRVAFLCMNEFIERNGFELTVDDDDDDKDDDDDDDAFATLVGVAAGNVSEEELASWVSARIRRLDDVA